MNLDKLHAIIFNPDANSRRRLRESLSAVAYKAEIRQTRSPAETINSLAHGGKIDVLFVSHSLGAEVIRQLLLDLRQANLFGKQKILVTVDNVLGGVGSAVVDLYLAGIDGFIAEPYSAQEISKLLQTVQDPSRALGKDAAQVRVRRAVELLASEAMQHIDQIADLEFAGTKERGSSQVELRRIHDSLAILVDQAPDAFADALATTLENARTPFKQPRRNNQKVQAKVQHPGELVDEIMRLRGLTRERVLGLVRIDPAQFDQLLAKAISIDDTMSRELARVLGKSAREWMQIQRKFDAAQRPK